MDVRNRSAHPALATGHIAFLPFLPIGIARRTLWFCVCMRGLIADVLQEPLRRDLPSLLRLHGLLVDQSAHRGELQALVADVAIEGDLVARGAALGLAADEIGEVRLVE